MEVIKLSKKTTLEAVQIPLKGNINLVEVSEWLGSNNGICMGDVVPGSYIIKDSSIATIAVDIITEEELEKRYIKMNDNGCVANKHVGVGYRPIAELLSEMIDHYLDLYNADDNKLENYSKKIYQFIMRHKDTIGIGTEYWLTLWRETKADIEKKREKCNENKDDDDNNIISNPELLSEMIDHYRDLYDVPRPRLDLYYRKIEDYIKGHDDTKNSDHWKRLWEDVKAEVEDKRKKYSGLYSEALDNIR